MVQNSSPPESFTAHSIPFVIYTFMVLSTSPKNCSSVCVCLWTGRVVLENFVDNKTHQPHEKWIPSDNNINISGGMWEYEWNLLHFNEFYFTSFYTRFTSMFSLDQLPRYFGIAHKSTYSITIDRTLKLASRLSFVSKPFRQQMNVLAAEKATNFVELKWLFPYNVDVIVIVCIANLKSGN